MKRSGQLLSSIPEVSTSENKVLAVPELGEVPKDNVLTTITLVGAETGVFCEMGVLEVGLPVEVEVEERMGLLEAMENCEPNVISTFILLQKFGLLNTELPLEVEVEEVSFAFSGTILSE